MMANSKKKPTVTPADQAALRQWMLDTLPDVLGARYFLVDAELVSEAGHWFLRVYVETRAFLTTGQRIDIDECATLSHLLDPVLEAHPLLADLSYFLEVSSPGLFRELREPRELTFYAGKAVRLEPAQKGGKKNAARLPFTHGILGDYDEASQQITISPAALSPGEMPPLTASLVISPNGSPAVRIFLDPPVEWPESPEPVTDIEEKKPLKRESSGATAPMYFNQEVESRDD